MSIRQVRVGVFLFFILYALVVIWPGALPFNRTRPFLLGIPFTMAWAILWIIMGGLALWLLDIFEERERAKSADVDPDGAVAHPPREVE